MRDAMLIVHLLGLAMGLGTSFAFMFIRIAKSNLKKVAILGKAGLLSSITIVLLAVLTFH